MTNPPSAFALAFMLIVGPALIAFGVFMQRRRHKILRRARQTTGTVIDGHVREMQGGCQPVVTYNYAVNGQHHVGTRVTPPPGEETIRSCFTARRIVKAYPPGTQVRVHYLPDVPETAFLRTEGSFFWIIPIGLGVALLVIAWRRTIGL
ncbi:DUF3592 domain-containing protein [Fodinicurvata sp. EGI_FJ10296]|uniref:DUF3592 domain-containing protein n=1 Tax=Fodinicurvata sp. EGI_FJ10296 TaxID=3231908 RepID=UPI003452311B